MTRETKVGLGMAGAFVTIVGGVLAYKMYAPTAEPADGGPQTAHVSSTPEKENAKPDAPAPPVDVPEPPDPGGGLAKLDPPPPDGPPPLDPPGAKDPKIADGPPPLDPPGEKPPLIKFPEPPDPLSPPPLDPPDRKVPDGPPPLDPPGGKGPKKPDGPPPLDPPGERPPVKVPEPPDPLIPPPFDPPGEKPKVKVPEVPDPVGPPPLDPPKSDELRTKIKFPEVPPLDPPDAYDRKYETPNPDAPGKPIGVPVVIKEQPDHVYAPPTPEGTPVIVPKDNWSPARSPGDKELKPVGLHPAVEKFDVELYRPKAGETYADISLMKYRTDRYASALRAFNTKHDPELTKPKPDKIIRIPNADYLDRRYASGAAEAPPGGREVIAKNDATPAVYRLDEVPGTLLKDRPATDRAKPGGEKLYRVRANDTIWIVSKQTLGSGDRWPEILRLNRDALKDVNQLREGMVLKLPADAKLDGPDSPR